MFMKFLKKKRDQKSAKNKDDFVRSDCDQQQTRKSESLTSSPVDMPKHLKSHRQAFSRLGQYSASRTSSHLSVSSGVTEASVSSVSSRTSNGSVKSTSANQWTYDIDRFKGAKNVPAKMKSMGYQDVWAQAFTFGGR